MHNSTSTSTVNITKNKIFVSDNDRLTKLTEKNAELSQRLGKLEATLSASGRANAQSTETTPTPIANRGIELFYPNKKAIAIALVSAAISLPLYQSLLCVGVSLMPIIIPALIKACCEPTSLAKKLQSLAIFSPLVLPVFVGMLMIASRTSRLEGVILFTYFTLAFFKELTASALIYAVSK